jgi:hypothetical protein
MTAHNHKQCLWLLVALFEKYKSKGTILFISQKHHSARRVDLKMTRAKTESIVVVVVCWSGNNESREVMPEVSEVLINNNIASSSTAPTVN